MLILDEPTNDLDTDMLAAMEDLLDSLAGHADRRLHDRYLLERVTDQQYAILDGRLRHLPGGVDEYLKLAALATSKPVRGRARVAGRAPRHPRTRHPRSPAPTAATAEKELAAIERRRLAKVGDAITDSKHDAFADRRPERLPRACSACRRTFGPRDSGGGDPRGALAGAERGARSLIADSG